MPDWRNDLRARLSSLRLSPTREAEIIDELSQHLDDRYQESLAGGLSADEATRAALGDFQGEGVLAQRMRSLRQAHAPTPITLGAPTGHLLTGLRQDVRYAIRTFSKRPGFAFATALTLALGIGATTAIFSVVYGVLLKPLPFAEPERLVAVRHIAPHGAGVNHGPATYLTYRENQQTFEAIGIWDPTEVSITGRGDPERVEALRVTSTTLPLLRVQPVAGRFFNIEDDNPGAPLRIVLTHAYWQRRFGGDKGVVGQSLSIDGRPAEVIGVLPSSFTFLRTRPTILVPMPLNPAVPRGISFGFQVLARLKPGATQAQANADQARMISLLPPTFAQLELRPNVSPLADEVTGDIGRILWILLAGVGLVLLIACGNVANLFLVRAEGRHQEFATRTALGASRGRIARTLLTESVVLGVVGGVIGVALAWGATGLLRTIAPEQLPRVDDIGLDVTVLLFALAISVLSGLLFGLFAVLRFGQPGLAALKEGGRGGSDAPARRRTRNGLVVAQVALALPLLIVSVLMIRTFFAMLQVDPGFRRPEEVQTFVIAIPSGLIADAQLAGRTFQNVADRLTQVPGVATVGLATSITMDGEDNGNPIEVEDAPTRDGERMPGWRFKGFGPGYFETMGIRLVAGRSITWSEIHERRPVVVISEPLARKYWGEPAKALGRRVRGCCGPNVPWREIVGVTGPERDDGLSQPATGIVYWPMLSESYGRRTMAYAVRSTRVGTPGFLNEISQAVWSVNPNLPLAAVQTVEEIRASSMAQTSFALVMLGIAASVALLISVVGIYGVIAYAVSQRTREIGLRMALGAQIRDVRTLFVRHGLVVTAAGIVLGIGIAVVVTRVMSGFLFGVGPMDPTTYAVVSATLAAVALLATYLPARRASRIDPIAALRTDA
jgi:putative ABC transport system permease protein